MSLITKVLKQTAVYWAPAVYDKFGRRSFAPPAEISVRWEQRTTKYVTKDGEEKTASGKIMTSADVDVGGYLFEGELDSGTPVDPSTNSNCWEVKHFDKTPNLKAIEFLREAFI